MVRDHHLYITVPSFFRCPISLDVMKSPVSLSTGVTYDRSSIQRWLDNGNNTCPATMQVLHTKDFVPNHTLQRLIQIWSESVRNRSGSVSSPPSSLPSQEEARDLVNEIAKKSTSCFGCLSKILLFAKEADENRKFLLKIDDFVPVLIDVLASVSTGCLDVDIGEQVVKVLDLTVKDYELKERLMRLMLDCTTGDCLSSIVLVLQRGSLDSRIAAARVLESIAVDAESKLAVAGKDMVLPELFRLLSSDSDKSGIEAALSCLIAVSITKPIKLRIVRLGAVKQLGELLCDFNTHGSVIEKTLKLLQTVSSCTEGRLAMCGDPICIKSVVQKMLKVSNVTTEHAVTILWSLCYLFRDQKAQELVTECNGLTKILLLMQSNCSPAVRQMACDLLKIFRVNSKSCLSSYDTKTTHIMPF